MSSIKDYQWDMEGPDKDEYSLNDTNRKQMRELLNKTGKGFCLAKWTQVTMHLGFSHKYMVAYQYQHVCTKSN